MGCAVLHNMARAKNIPLVEEDQDKDRRRRRRAGPLQQPPRENVRQREGPAYAARDRYVEANFKNTPIRRQGNQNRQHHGERGAQPRRHP